MFKLLNELNIDNKNCKNLALLPGFNIIETNSMNEKNIMLNKNLDSPDILDDKILIKLISVVNENKNMSNSRKKRKKRKKLYLEKSKASRKKK